MALKYFPAHSQRKRLGKKGGPKPNWTIRLIWCLVTWSGLAVSWLQRQILLNGPRYLGWSINPSHHDRGDEGVSSMSLPMASFQSVSESLPTTTIDGVSFPRGGSERSYMGTGLWNSRMSLPKALMAMFGSKSAYVETPLFTLCRLQLQHGSDIAALEEAMRKELFMTNDLRRDWLSYFIFMKEYESQNLTDCALRDGRHLGEIPAAKMAQHIFDRKFQNASYEALANSRVKALQPQTFYEPFDLMYATIYPYVAAQYYGPSVLVLNPDGRGLDLGYYGATKRSLANEPINSCNKFPQEDPADAGEILTPGYKLPDSIAGFEIRREVSVADHRKVGVGKGYHTGKQVPSITHAFYKESMTEGTAVFMLHFPPGKVHCAIPTNAADAKGAFFECNHGGKVPGGDHCVLSKDNGNFTKPLMTTGFIFDETFKGGCTSAESLLLGLSPDHRDTGENAQYLYSQMFQDVISTVSVKLGRDVFIAHFDSSGGGITCKKVFAHKDGTTNLWQKHRKIASLHVGLDTHYSTCAALLPSSWSNEGLDWSTTVVSKTLSNPFDIELFPVTKAKASKQHYSPPNWVWFLGLLQKEDQAFCGGFKGSLCEVEITANQHLGVETEEFKYQLECTYAGAWFASLNDPLKCHSFARHLPTFVVSGPETGTETIIGIKERRYNEPKGGDFEALRLSQATLDPLHWRRQYRGTLNVFMSSDLHGYIHGNCGSSFCSSGAPSLASVIDTIRISSAITRSPTLVLDAGDALFGSGVAPKDVIETMSTLGYDAMALGNHELDIGAPLLQELAADAKFSLLAANVKVDGIKSLSGALAKDVMIGGTMHHICVIGLSSPEPNPLAGSELTFINSTDAIVAELNAISTELMCDIKILLSHMGFKEDKAISLATGSASKVSSPLSLIIGGHSHFVLGQGSNHQVAENGDTILDEPFPFMHGGVPIAHIGSNGMNAGIFDIQTLPVKESSFELRTTVKGVLQPLGVGYGVFPNVKLKFPPPWVEALDGVGLINIESRPSSSSVCTVLCRRGECLAGNMVTDAMRDCAQNIACGGYDHLLSGLPHIALLESGTLRSCLKNMKDDMSRMLPWPNKLVVITMKGSAVRAMLEHGLKTKIEMQGGGLLQTSGLHYKFTGDKVLEAWLVEDLAQVVSHQSMSDHVITFDSEAQPNMAQEKQVLQDNDSYRVVVSDWLVSGGDGFGPVLKQGAEITEYLNITLREALYFYSSKNPLVRTEMRIVDSSALKRESSTKHSIAAFIGSFAASILSFPLYSHAVLKATSMVSPSRTVHLWHGAVLATLAGALSNVIFFTIFFHTKLFRGSFLRAVFAGFVNVLVTNPLWVIVTRLQTSATRRITAVGVARKIIQDEGYFGFFHGLSWNLIMIVYPTIRQSTLNMLQTLVVNEGHTMDGLRGMAASCLATIATYPIQRWRIRSQAALPCRMTGLFDGVLYKLLQSGVAGFILFAVISGSNDVLDLILN